MELADRFPPSLTPVKNSAQYRVVPGAIEGFWTVRLHHQFGSVMWSWRMKKAVLLSWFILAICLMGCTALFEDLESVEYEADAGADTGTDGDASEPDGDVGECSEDESLCGGECVDTDGDPDHCGECGNSCDANTPICYGGQCRACVEAADCGEPRSYQCQNNQCVCDDTRSEEQVCSDAEVQCGWVTDDCGREITCDFGCHCDVAGGQFGGGSGSVDDPFLICTGGHLQYLSLADDHWDAAVMVVDDFDMANVSTNFNGIGDADSPFEGIFDGNGREISFLTPHRDSGESVGMFGVVGSSGQIKNVILVDTLVTGDRWIGGLVAQNSGEISNCQVSGIIEESNKQAGGLVGVNSGLIVDSSANMDIVVETHAGGLVAINLEEGRIVDSFAGGSLTAFEFAGGLVAKNNGQVERSFSWAAVSGTYAVGGLVGQNRLGEIRDSYATGDVAGEVQVGVGTVAVGGLVGRNMDSASVLNSYSIGEVIGDDDEVGGLVGRNESGGEVVNSYWDVTTSGLSNSDAGLGLTTEQFGMTDYFNGWDFENIWKIAHSADGNDRPLLRWLINQ